MDFIKNFTENKEGEKKEGAPAGEQKGGLEGMMGQAGNFFNEQAGGGAKGEKKEDGLDKAYDMFQEKVLGQGPQNNESAAEQAKDEFVTDTFRDGYKKATGKEFFVKDNE